MRDDGLVYLAAGTIAAILLGMALVPLRDFTTASNFTFPFLALTIVVAEFGGRKAAVATALSSAFSLDFFLTKPYLMLTIEGKHDIIAFAGLTVCGLIAAAFGSERSRRVAALSAARRHLDLLHDTLRHLEEGGPVEPALTRVLDRVRAALPLSAAVVRDERGEVVAVSERGHDLPAPGRILEPHTLLPPEVPARSLPSRGLPLPVEGGRLALRARNRQIGWLDVWGNGAPASAEQRRELSDVGRLIGALLASSSVGLR